MLTEKDYCDKDTAFALQELGYNPYMFYDDGTPAIHLWYAQKWLREEHNLHIEITYSPSCWTGKIYDLKERDYIKGFTFFESFEETLHTLIKEAVKILTNNKNE
jgi:hypothetical protein